MKIKLEIEYQGKEIGTVIEVPRGVGDALVNVRRPPIGVEVDGKGNPKKKPGPSEVK